MSAGALAAPSSPPLPYPRAEVNSPGQLRKQLRKETAKDFSPDGTGDRGELEGAGRPKLGRGQSGTLLG